MIGLSYHLLKSNASKQVTSKMHKICIRSSIKNGIATRHIYWSRELLRTNEGWALGRLDDSVCIDRLNRKYTIIVFDDCRIQSVINRLEQISGPRFFKRILLSPSTWVEMKFLRLQRLATYQYYPEYSKANFLLLSGHHVNHYSG